MASRPYRLLLGIDEAGYGPNLGPLVIGCSSWWLDETAILSPIGHPTDPNHATEKRPLTTVDHQGAMQQSQFEAALTDLLPRLAPHFLAKPLRKGASHVPLGDSKAIYSSGTNLDSLESGVRFWLDQLHPTANSHDERMICLQPDWPKRQSQRGEWYELEVSGGDEPRPLAFYIEPNIFEAAANHATQSGLRIADLSCHVIDEVAFNQGVERWENKSNLLSMESIVLARRALDRLREVYPNEFSQLASIEIHCDKHGGRNRYQPVLSQVFPELWFTAVCESNTRSIYSTASEDQIPMRWTFSAKGDRSLAPALASMLAKWIRELFMKRLNAFWQAHQPTLRPTAGYPVDAQRFRRDIETTARILGLPDHLWWRSR